MFSKDLAFIWPSHSDFQWKVGNPKRMGSSLSILSVGLWLGPFTVHLTPLLALECFAENPGGPRSDKVDFPKYLKKALGVKVPAACCATAHLSSLCKVEEPAKIWLARLEGNFFFPRLKISAFQCLSQPKKRKEFPELTEKYLALRSLLKDNTSICVFP